MSDSRGASEGTEEVVEREDGVKIGSAFISWEAGGFHFWVAILEKLERLGRSLENWRGGERDFL